MLRGKLAPIELLNRFEVVIFWLGGARSPYSLYHASEIEGLLESARPFSPPA
jgi:hypothetical protein